MTQSKCKYEACFAHDDGGCQLGESKLKNCQYWQNKTPEGMQEIAPIDGRVLWSGSALGTVDLNSLLPRARHMLIGVLGAHDAGKTTLLIANYLQLLRGKQFGKMEFSGSRTLGAWEALAAWLRLHDAADRPSFPPHTPSGAERMPGLLHLALRNELDEFRDVLLTDAPGEWFARWANNETAPGAVGAAWIAEHADAFLLIADCEQLSGENRGAARKALRSLIERLGNHAKTRPVMLVWTKSEDQFCVPDNIRAAIEDALKSNLPAARQESVTVTKPESLLEVMQTCIEQCWDASMAGVLPTMPPIPIPSMPIFEPFFAFRGQDETA